MSSSTPAVELLIEIGCEEIPARMLGDAAGELRNLVADVLDRSGLAHGAAEPYHTPRRLAVRVADVATATPAREELLLGPPAAVAWNEDGSPSRALEGFARKQGLEPSALERVETPRGLYAGTRVGRGGEPLAAVLARALPPAIARMSFPKSMRWGRGEHRFVRPVHWIVALAGEEVVELELFGVRSGRMTRGHRALAPGEHAVPGAEAWERLLADLHVVVDPARRRERLAADIDAAAAAEGGRLVPDDELLDESVGLVEYPGALVGSFDARFVETLPAEVLATCLRHHQKAFSVAREGRPLPAFAVAVNVAADPAGHVRRGHEWVVGGRLDDALFFWQEDRKRPLAERVAELERVVFHRDLGTYAAKSRRLVRLTETIAPRVDLSAAERQQLVRACLLSRCDLVTGLVGEFPELQGVAGGLLARADGEPEPIAAALYDLYRPAGADDPLPTTLLGRLLGLADRLDTLAGGFAVGLVPSGSRDPFALRRAGTAVVRLAASFPGLDLRPLLRAAGDGYAGGELGPDLRDQAPAAAEELHAFLVERFCGLGERAGARYDELAAVRAVVSNSDDELLFADLEARLDALRQFRESEDFLALAAAAKRVRNILAQAAERRERPAAGEGAAELREPAEIALAQAVGKVEDRARATTDAADHRQALEEIARLRPSVDQFFDDILVMVDDPALRRARLGLLARVNELAHSVVDIAELVVEGHERR